MRLSGRFSLKHIDNTPGEAEIALFDAIEAGDEAAARGILRSGLNVNARNEFSRTALHLAASHGMAGLIPDLVAAGAELEPEGAAGETPMTMSVVHEKPDCLAALIAAGAGIDYRDEENGWTALSWAVMKSRPRPAMAALLLDSGADPFLKDKKGECPADLTTHTATHDALLSQTREGADDMVRTIAILRAHIQGSRQAARVKALRRKLHRPGP